MRAMERLALSMFVAAALAGASGLGAQTVRGSLVDRGAQPVSGVVVMLLDSADRVVAQTLSSESGAYVLRAPEPGRYRVRVLRLGFRPELSEELVLGAGQVLDESMELDGATVSLAAVRVSDESACGRRTAGSATELLTVWDQAMTSIVSTSLASEARGLVATALVVSRTMDPRGRRVRAQEVTSSTGRISRPWRSLSAADLRARGYAELEADGSTTYHAPGLDVLSSPLFLEDHCLRIQASREAGEVGVAFAPAPGRSRSAGIRGVLWMDRATAELRRLEFSYVNVPGAPPVAVDIAGGEMRFVRLPGGTSVITQWEIRMPQLVKSSPRAPRAHVEEIRSVGGALVVLRSGADTLFRRPSLEVTGAVVDSASGRPVRGAAVELAGTGQRVLSDSAGRFVLPDVLPGEYTVEVRTPALDSVGAASSSVHAFIEGAPDLLLRVPTVNDLARATCGQLLLGAAGRGKGAVLGVLREVTGRRDLSGARVVARWSELSIRTGSSSLVTRSERRLESEVDAEGRFKLCGVPVESELTISAVLGAEHSDAMVVRLEPDERFRSTVLRLAEPPEHEPVRTPNRE